MHIISDFKMGYPEVFEGLGRMNIPPVGIHLSSDAIPTAVHAPRRIPLPLYDKAKAEMERMLQKGIIREEKGPTEWCSPMVCVPKKSSDGSEGLRICVDLTALNKYVQREARVLPSTEECLGRLKNAKVMTKLDANSGYWQIPLTKEASKLTTFLTPFGRYSFRVLPFGITSASEIFQARI